MKDSLLWAEGVPGNHHVLAVLLTPLIAAAGTLAGLNAKASDLSGPAPHPGVSSSFLSQSWFPYVPIKLRKARSLWTVRSRYDTLIEETARRHEVDPALVKAIVQAESAFDPKAVSRTGARGLMQVLPETASRFAIKNLNDPRQNLKAGVLYLKHLLEIFDGNITKAVAAYNAGPNTVRRYRGVPPYRETQNYLVKVMGLREAYASQLGPS